MIWWIKHWKKIWMAKWWQLCPCCCRLKACMLPWTFHQSWSGVVLSNQRMMVSLTAITRRLYFISWHLRDSSGHKQNTPVLRESILRSSCLWNEHAVFITKCWDGSLGKVLHVSHLCRQQGWRLGSCNCFVLHADWWSCFWGEQQNLLSCTICAPIPCYLILLWRCQPRFRFKSDNIGM